MIKGKKIIERLKSVFGGKAKDLLTTDTFKTLLVNPESDADEQLVVALVKTVREPATITSKFNVVEKASFDGGVTWEDNFHLAFRLGDDKAARVVFDKAVGYINSDTHERVNLPVIEIPPAAARFLR